MASRIVPIIPLDGEADYVAVQQQSWRKVGQLSSLPDRAEAWLERAGFDRAPWLAIGLASGIAAWFGLPEPIWWLTTTAGSILVAMAALARGRDADSHVHLRRAVVAMTLLFAIGLALVWTRSALIGAEPIARPQVLWIDGRVLLRENQPAEDRVRLTLAYRDAETALARKARVNVAPESLDPRIVEGARVHLRARLMPPAPPMVPGAYDFARTAWFAGLSATGSAIGPVMLVEQAKEGGTLAAAQRALSTHVRAQLSGSPGTIAAAFASGDRRGISTGDEEAMRDSGLTHLLSISGLHVSAVIAGAYFLALRLLALWPWLTLRVRLPLLAAACGAGAGIGYTLLTGAEVPTVRSCVGSLLVLGALALGREPLSLRMVATAAFVVMLAWPEAVVSPSFQMSFVAVIAIVTLHDAQPVRTFLAPREESTLTRLSRRTAMLLLTGFVIELALMPIVLFHFHRAGFYGAIANVVAIPLVTFVTMPLIAVALALDVVGLGTPAWALVGASLDLMLGIAHFIAAQPGAVKLMPQMGAGTFALFVAGGAWLALWRGRQRLYGLVPVVGGVALLLGTQAPDVLISGDGRNVGVAGEGDRLLVLREGRSDFARDNLLELAAMSKEPVVVANWPDARCSEDFCALSIVRGGQTWDLLMGRSRSRIEERALAAACERSDIVIADRWLPASCRPRWLKADRSFLEQHGGLALYLGDRRIIAVSDSQGEHPWWMASRPEPRLARSMVAPKQSR
jgi:competence protein ComEC